MSRTSLTEYLKDSISSFYSEYRNIYKTAVANHVGYSTAVKVLNEKGFNIKPREVVTPEIRIEMARLYNEEKLSTWQIGKKLGFLNVCVMNNLHDAGVIMRNRSEAAKTYSVYQNYFEKIDSEDKAYILGLIWADGNIHKDQFTLALQDKDKEILEKIREKIKSTGPLLFRKRQKSNYGDMWTLRVYDMFFCQPLKNLGVIERKTSTLEFPKFLEHKFYASFLRGIIDGDGCIYFDTKNNKLNYSICLAGSEFVGKDVKIILENIGISSYLYQMKGSRGWVVRCSSTQALKLMNFIYGEMSDLYLPRKYNKFLEIVNHLNKTSSTRRKDTLIILEESNKIIK